MKMIRNIKNKRRDGYYWVKRSSDSEWEVMKFENGKFDAIGAIAYFVPSDLYQIKARLHNPK